MAADSEGGAPTRPEFKHGKVCYLVVPSRDPRRSSDFYRNIFGWNIRTNDEGGISFDDSTGQVSGTWVTDRPPASKHNLEVHIMVENLDAVITAIREAGGTVDPDDIHREPSDGPSSPTPTATGSASSSSRGSAIDMKH
jgi:uncharacterized protein